MSDILIASISLLVGGILSWIIADLYYRKNTADLKALEKSVPEKLKKILIENSDRQLSFEELKNLIDKQIYDMETDDPLPYKKCPNCGNEELVRSGGENSNGEAVFIINCNECGWSELTM